MSAAGTATCHQQLELGLTDRRCFCSAALRESDGLVVCAAGHVYELASALRDAEPPILVRIHRGALLLDPRTLTDSDVDAVARAFDRLAFEKST